MVRSTRNLTVFRLSLITTNGLIGVTAPRIDCNHEDLSCRTSLHNVVSPLRLYLHKIFKVVLILKGKTLKRIQCIKFSSHVTSSFARRHIWTKIQPHHVLTQSRLTHNETLNTWRKLSEPEMYEKSKNCHYILNYT